MTDDVILTALHGLAKGFNDHDADAVLAYFSDDSVMELPIGPDACGQRFSGKAAIRQGALGRFSGMPDVQWRDARHSVSGDIGLSTWTITGTQTDGSALHVNGCDIYTFRDGLVVKKDSYWKRRA